MKYHCIETTIDFLWNGWDIRLWINHTNLPQDHLQERKYVNEMFKHFNKAGEQTINSMIEYLKNIPNINAIQIKGTGNPCFGTMVYTVPF